MGIDKAEQTVRQAISDGFFPGAAFCYFNEGRLETRFCGHFTYCPDSPLVSRSTVWDLASVSKVISTTSATMILVQEGKLDLDWPVARVIPEFEVNDKSRITLRNLMRHDSGLIAFRPYHKTHRHADSVKKTIFQEKLVYETGSKMVYSDLNMILMDEAILRLTGLSLDQFFSQKIARPLGLDRIGYWTYAGGTFQDQISRTECAPTERLEDWRATLRRLRLGNIGSEKMFGFDPEYIQGEVHDPTATVLGGVAGHAGLFSDLESLARFMKNFISEKPRVFSTEVRNSFVKRQESKSSRGLGWDTKSETGSSAGSMFGPRAFGHTGYTGTSIWADLDSQKFSILLTNRVHPTSENTKIIPFRSKFHDTLLGESD